MQRWLLTLMLTVAGVFVWGDVVVVAAYAMLVMMLVLTGDIGIYVCVCDDVGSVVGVDACVCNDVGVGMRMLW